MSARRTKRCAVAAMVGLSVLGSTAIPSDAGVWSAGFYCLAEGGPVNIPYIGVVHLGTIHNATDDGSYTDYTQTHSTPLVVGLDHELSVVVIQGELTDQCGVWIDWNRDLDFTDPGETIPVVATATPGISFDGTVTPPPGVGIGATRLHIRVTRGTAALPCGIGVPGEVEDYEVVVVDYCPAEGGDCPDDSIRRVQFGGLDNQSGCQEYSDFRHLSADVIPGSTYQLTVTRNSGGAGGYCAAWADWNRDADFDDPGEAIPMAGAPGSGPYTATFGPPAIDPGPVRLRLRLHPNFPGERCGAATGGEVEDYTINVIESPYCVSFGDCDAVISRVRLHQIDNATGCTTGYSDFSHLSTVVAPATDYPMTVNLLGAGPAGTGTVWIDWNRDLDFDDPDETVIATFGGSTLTATITPPTDAPPGPTRMRVRYVSVGSAGPCAPPTTGEVEDYTLIVDSCPADLSDNAAVDFGDILAVITAWGPCPGCPQDLNGNGSADFADILAIIEAWGPCP